LVVILTNGKNPSSHIAREALDGKAGALDVNEWLNWNRRCPGTKALTRCASRAMQLLRFFLRQNDGRWALLKQSPGSRKSDEPPLPMIREGAAACST
jgi:hypothetical protein